MDERTLSKKLTNARMQVLKEHPFFGRLLLKLSFGLAQCQTAFTDMRRIVFDPNFAERLSDAELKYVLIHEVLHCALKHCTRGASKQHFIYNIACDIVVNSTILEMYNEETISIDGEEMMHLAPDKSEGRLYTAEEVYAMLMSMSPDDFNTMYCAGRSVDNHDFWNGLESPASLEDLWNQHLRETAKTCGSSMGIPCLLRRYIKEIDHSPHTNWRQVLHDFIQFSRSDYDFSQPDRRYSSDIILPSFRESMDGSKVEKVWFLVDTSASISNEALSVAYGEIKQATVQIDNLSGVLSFFDTKVSEPSMFESLEDILDVKPIGGGGTDFYSIFKELARLQENDDLPNVVIILTDGYARFPEEGEALGVPVIWIIVDSDVIPPWGTYAFIGT